MAKLLLFSILLRLTSNPLIALFLILILYYVVDRRFLGLLPSIRKPFRKWMRVSQLQKVISLNPHDMPARYELAQTYIEQKQHMKALRLLASLPKTMQASADVLVDTGTCYLWTGDLEQGKQLIMDALTIDEHLRRGDPYLILANAFASSDPDQAIQFLQQFQQQNSSSCESYYRLGVLQHKLGNREQARDAFKLSLDTYRTLPKFRKRIERRWAIRSYLRLFA